MTREQTLQAIRATGEEALCYLVAIKGPALPPLELRPGARALTLGRAAHCELRLPAGAEHVSRVHARFLWDGVSWGILDQGSRWGTFVNGCRLEPGKVILLSDGDLIGIAPWVFSWRERIEEGTLLRGDVQQTMTIGVPPASEGQDQVIIKLLEEANQARSLAREQELILFLLDQARHLTGYPNASWIRRLDGAGRVEIVASRSGESVPPAFSRTLVDGASSGTIVTFRAGEDVATQSIRMLGTRSAVVLPIALGDEPAAFLYLDARQQDPEARAGLATICSAMARVASLLYGNAKRLEMERRQARVESDLDAAALVHRSVMPPARQTIGAFLCCGMSRPGYFVAGDFFDVVPLPEGRLAVAIGDAAGKGVPAAVLVTTAHGYLRASLQHHGQVKRCVEELQAFLSPRMPPGRFLTLWVGVIDPTVGTLTYVDAGHGYALLRGHEERATLNEGGGVPVGLLPAATYEEITISYGPGDELLLVSDGFIEQPAAGATAENRKELGIQGLWGIREECRGKPEELELLFEALARHAGSDRWDDDATAVLVSWQGN